MVLHQCSGSAVGALVEYHQWHPEAFRLDLDDRTVLILILMRVGFVALDALSGLSIWGELFEALPRYAL